MKTFRKYHNRFSRALILVFLGGLLIMGVHYSFKKSDIRNTVFNHIRSGIAPEQLLHFQFTKSEMKQLNWKKSNEFELAGEMYDIVESKAVDDMVYYVCFHDTKETKLKRRLYKFLSRFIDSDQNNDSDQHKTNLVQKVYFNQHLPIDGLIIRSLSKHKRMVYHLKKYTHDCLDLSTPPPEVI